ncbi:MULTISPECIES: hypothetical protein [unclassified Pseudoalteromonas]|uniref:hypothetical protein n=1 Tax=unclassified Pseudoalteromonas TaxID=194690 RepID=UPI001BB1057F|nr:MULTISPECIES: hypothetical protein [unclassified Pseudoalteromonas]
MTAPEHIRQQCYVPSSYRCIVACKALEMNSENILEETLISMLKPLAERWVMLSQELKQLIRNLKH